MTFGCRKHISSTVSILTKRSNLKADVSHQATFLTPGTAFSDKCQFCPASVDNAEHALFGCPRTQKIRDSVKTDIRAYLGNWCPQKQAVTLASTFIDALDGTPKVPPLFILANLLTGLNLDPAEAKPLSRTAKWFIHTVLLTRSKSPFAVSEFF